MIELPIFSRRHRRGPQVERESRLQGVGIGLFAALVITGLKIAFAVDIGGPTPFLLYFAAVMVAAWRGGLVAGVVIGLVTTFLATFLFVEPARQLAKTPAGQVQAFTFLLEGGVIAFFTSRLQRALIQSRLAREWFAGTLDSVGDAVLATDLLGRVTFLNGVGEQLCGLPSREALGRRWSEVLRLDGVGADRDPIDALPRGQGGGRSAYLDQRQDDRPPRPLAVRARALPGPAGARAGTIVIFHDATNELRREARKAFLMRATAELTSSLEYEKTLAVVAGLAVPEFADWCAVDIVGPGGVRRVATAHMDPAKVDFVRRIEERYPTPPDSPSGVPNILRTGRAEFAPDIPDCALEEAALDAEHLALIRQLGLRSFIGVPIRQGEATVGVIRLVMAESGRRYDEQDLDMALALGERAGIAIQNAALYREATTARADAERANRSKDEFLAMLGHELRNPLAPILTALDVMGHRAGAPFLRERTVIERQVTHLVRLVDDLLDVSSITRGAIKLGRERLSIEEAVARAIEMASPLLEARSHHLAQEVEPGLFVDADPLRLAQVFANLLTNAAKYTPSGGQIAVRAAREDDQIVVSVHDNGIGISGEMLARVFDLFAQEKQTLERAQGGLGLGLAIVKSLVELHGGAVEAHSDGLGQGSEFVVRLPALAPSAASHATAAAAPPPRPSARRAVLLVDDNRDALELLAAGLSLLGYETVQATDGPSALALAERDPPDVALLDIGLPVMDGYELAQRFRSSPRLAQVHLVAVTGYGQPSDRRRSSSAGFDAHLVKPVPMELVQETIERLAAPSVDHPPAAPRSAPRPHARRAPG